MKALRRFFWYIFWAAVTAVIAWIVRKAFQRAAQTPMATNERVSANAMQKAKALVRDPVCGTYIAEEISYLLMQGGESLHFCSRDCMQHYQSANRLATGA